MSHWKDEAVWLIARAQVMHQIQTWERSPWIHYKGYMHVGEGKAKYIAKLKARLARIEESGEAIWRERVRSESR